MLMSISFRLGKTNPAMAALGKTDVRDIKGWFKMFDVHANHVYDHVIKIADHEIEGSDTSSVMSYSTLDMDGGRSRSSTLDSVDHHEIGHEDGFHDKDHHLIKKAAAAPQLAKLSEKTDLEAEVDEVQAAVSVAKIST